MIRGPQVLARPHRPAPRRTGPAGWLRPHAEDLPAETDHPGSGLTIGVLALQGAFAEHATALKRLGAAVKEVRRIEHLDGIDALVMPGGESTTMSRLLSTSGLFEVLDAKLAAGFPVFGTCAGMILLATDVLDGRLDQRSFAALDIAVRRNGYGRQVDSFEAGLDIDALDGDAATAEGEAAPAGAPEPAGEVTGGPFPAVFIRAPKIERCGADVDVLAARDGVPVLVRHGRVLAASFHPEMTADLRVHRYFLDHVVRAAATSTTPPAR